eukprot:TRINITY_DN92096_c0_g1_i1.p1 TRINITY_DN92096_c0_g1~~TRINITY_DN92096_c0_g1_i1.p1  ORF type:complete len:753 (+),score=144.60 TRINITY_DN92096_c0_g1_i1:68-2260(+)
MARKRSGAQRRQAQKEAARLRLEELHEEAAADSRHKADAAGDQLRSTAAQPATKRAHLLVPEPQEVVAAIASLYIDQLKPFGRILRKRILERHMDRINGATDVSNRDAEDEGEPRALEVDANRLRKLCESSQQLVVTEESGDWSAVLVGCPGQFVDVYSAEDTYSEDFWAAAAEYFEGLGDDDPPLPGGRYSCAQELLFRGLPFLKGLSLGAICHIIQLAISRRKLLGYRDGAVVPYSRSQSMLKERCATEQQPCATRGMEHESLAFASWNDVRRCILELLNESSQDRADGGPGLLPLSNVKRVFRARFRLELSETVLGHAKLSELLQDERLKDMCTVRLDKQGYSVVQVLGTVSAPHRRYGDAEAATPREIAAPRIRAAVAASDVACEAPAPHMSTSPAPEEDDMSSPVREAIESALRSLEQEAAPCQAAEKKSAFCIDEPLSLEDAFTTATGEEMPTFGPTPCPLSSFGDWRPGHDLRLLSLYESAAEPEQVLAPPHATADGPSYLDARLSAAGLQNFNVQNTFLHESLPPPTPVQGAAKRATSLPKDLGSEKIDDASVPFPASLENLRSRLGTWSSVSASTSARSCASSTENVGHIDQQAALQNDLSGVFEKVLRNEALMQMPLMPPVLPPTVAAQMAAQQPVMPPPGTDVGFYSPWHGSGFPQAYQVEAGAPLGWRAVGAYIPSVPMLSGMMYDPSAGHVRPQEPVGSALVPLPQKIELQKHIAFQ